MGYADSANDCSSAFAEDNPEDLIAILNDDDKIEALVTRSFFKELTDNGCFECVRDDLYEFKKD